MKELDFGHPSILELLYLEEIPSYELKEHAGDDAIVRLANMILLKSIAGNEEDILLEPLEQEIEVHLGSTEPARVVSRLPAFIFPVLSMRFKSMADLDLDEVNSPQSGRIRLRHKDHDIDLKLTSFPGKWGEQLRLKVLMNKPKSD